MAALPPRAVFEAMIRLIHLGVCGAALALLAALLSGSAQAAAIFDHASPSPGQVLRVSPASVDIYTRRPTSPDPKNTQVIVQNHDSQRVDLGDMAVDPADHHHFHVSLPPGLAPGRYIVTFKTMEEAGYDPDGGQFAFYVGVQPTPADRAADKLLTLTLPADGDAISGYQRGIVEGLLTAVIIVPVAGWYVLRRRRKGASGDGLLPGAGG
ncbi:MAG TPA: copper resistance protein CopC [Dehalococcoidia bacterium]|nr:copper resistance protein CopC [Dehalococcoidia bacterium]